jgi:hypothetical protein
MKSTNKQKKKVTQKKKHELSDVEMRRIYNKWMKNYIKGIDEILNLSRENQQYLWFCVLNECLYSCASNPILAQMYKSDGLYEIEDLDLLDDAQLVPMNKSRLVEGMKIFLMDSGKRKWADTLNKIELSAMKGDY